MTFQQNNLVYWHNGTWWRGLFIEACNGTHAVVENTEIQRNASKSFERMDIGKTYPSLSQLMTELQFQEKSRG